MPRHQGSATKSITESFKGTDLNPSEWLETESLGRQAGRQAAFLRQPRQVEARPEKAVSKGCKVSEDKLTAF